MQLSHGETDKQHVVVQKQRRSGWSTVAMLFLLLFAVAAGTAAWFWYMWQADHTSLTDARTTTSKSEQTITGLRNELSNAKESLSAATNSAANKTDEDMIKAAALQHDRLLTPPTANPEVKMTKKDGNQAIASVGDSASGAGYMAYLKKVDNQWFVVWSGQNTPPSDVITLYGIKIQ